MTQQSSSEISLRKRTTLLFIVFRAFGQTINRCTLAQIAGIFIRCLFLLLRQGYTAAAAAAAGVVGHKLNKSV
jgi:hypothetical protein